MAKNLWRLRHGQAGKQQAAREWKFEQERSLVMSLRHGTTSQVSSCSGKKNNNTMLPPIEGAIRNGFIPLCCGMASGCFAFYGLQAQKAALQWSVLPSDDEHVKRQYFRHAIELQQHSTTVAAMSVVSAIACREAYADWSNYHILESYEQIEQYLLRRRPPFFLRWTVIATTAASLLAAHKATGRIRWWQPQRPVIITSRSATGTEILSDEG